MVMMADKKKPDRHKPSRITRVPDSMAKQLAYLCKRHESKLVDEVKVAVREYLERHNLWPPPEKGKP
jgi:hypothetical protein